MTSIFLNNNLNINISDGDFVLGGTTTFNYTDENPNVEYKVVPSSNLATQLNMLKPDINDIINLLPEKNTKGMRKNKLPNTRVIKTIINRLVTNKLKTIDFDNYIVLTMFNKYFFKYLSCFYNTPNNMNNKLYFGVTDNGISTGIPIKDIYLIKHQVMNYINDPEQIVSHLKIDSNTHSIISEYLKNIKITFHLLDKTKHAEYMAFFLNAKNENIHDIGNQITNIMNKYLETIDHINSIKYMVDENKQYIVDRFYTFPKYNAQHSFSSNASSNVDHISSSNTSSNASSNANAQHISNANNYIKNYIDHVLFFFILGIQTELRHRLYQIDGFYNIQYNNLQDPNQVNNQDINKVSITVDYDKIENKIKELTEISGENTTRYIDSIKSIKRDNIDFSSIFNSRNEINYLLDVVIRHYTTKLSAVSEKHQDVEFSDMYQKIQFTRIESLYNIMSNIGYNFYVIEIDFPPAPNNLFDDLTYNDGFSYTRKYGKNKQISCLKNRQHTNYNTNGLSGSSGPSVPSVGIIPTKSSS
jgi:hypothetical protein